MTQKGSSHFLKQGKYLFCIPWSFHVTQLPRSLAGFFFFFFSVESLHALNTAKNLSNVYYCNTYLIDLIFVRLGVLQKTPVIYGTACCSCITSNATHRGKSRDVMISHALWFISHALL